MESGIQIRLGVQRTAGSIKPMKHELWKDIGGEEYSYYTFCLAGPHGDDARKLLGPLAELIWVVEASSHFEAMAAYHKFMGWGEYTTDQEWDMQPYPEEWSVQ